MLQGCLSFLFIPLIGDKHCAFVCLGTVCGPDPIGDNGQAQYHLPTTCRFSFAKHTQPQSFGSGIVDQSENVTRRMAKAGRTSHSDTSQKR